MCCVIHTLEPQVMTLGGHRFQGSTSKIGALIVVVVVKKKTDGVNMQDQHIIDLKDALSMALLTSPYDPSGYTPEHMLIRKLAEVVSEYDVGNISPTDFRTILQNNPIPGWSWDQWLADMVAEGVYHEAVWDTGGDDE